MPSFRYGERFSTVGVYVKHPPGSASPLASGDPLDAGTAHVVENDVVHLAAEGCRNLVWDNLPGAVSYEGRGYDYDDLAEPPSDWLVASDPLRLIGWGRKNSRRYGPFFAVRDEVAADGSYVPRGIRCQLDHDAAATDPFRVFAAITRTPTPPTEGALDWEEFAVTASSTGVLTVTLRADTWPAGAMSPSVLCRGNTSLLVAPKSSPVPVWIWLGWYVPDGTKIQFLYTFSAYETRA